MSNIKTEKDGIKWLSKKIQEDGWKLQPNPNGNKTFRGEGYDLLLKKGNEIRYVEVKTTKKEKFNQRWLESLEMKAMNKHKNKFFLIFYWVKILFHQVRLKFLCEQLYYF